MHKETFAMISKVIWKSILHHIDSYNHWDLDTGDKWKTRYKLSEAEELKWKIQWNHILYELESLFRFV